MFFLYSGFSAGASEGVYCGDLVIRSMTGKSSETVLAFKVERVGSHLSRSSPPPPIVEIESHL